MRVAAVLLDRLLAIHVLARILGCRVSVKFRSRVRSKPGASGALTLLNRQAREVSLKPSRQLVEEKWLMLDAPVHQLHEEAYLKDQEVS